MTSTSLLYSSMSPCLITCVRMPSTTGYSCTPSLLLMVQGGIPSLGLEPGNLINLQKYKLMVVRSSENATYMPLEMGVRYDTPWLLTHWMTILKLALKSKYLAKCGTGQYVGRYTAIHPGEYNLQMCTYPTILRLRFDVPVWDVYTFWLNLKLICWDQIFIGFICYHAPRLTTPSTSTHFWRLLICYELTGENVRNDWWSVKLIHRMVHGAGDGRINQSLFHPYIYK